MFVTSLQITDAVVSTARSQNDWISLHTLHMKMALCGANATLMSACFHLNHLKKLHVQALMPCHKQFKTVVEVNEVLEVKELHIGLEAVTYCRFSSIIYN